MRKFFTFKPIIFWVILLVNSSFAIASDDDLLLAKAAYTQKDAIALSAYVQQLQSEQHMLAAYAEYWLMLLTLNELDNQTVMDFINAHSDYPFAERLRGEYLKKLASEQDWAGFSAEFSNYKLEDTAVACYAAEASAVLGDVSLLEAAKPLWLQSKEQPSNCNQLFDRMQSANMLSEEDIWARFRLALADNRTSLAKGIVKRSRTFEPSQIKLIDKVTANPTAVLAKKSIAFNTRLGRELNFYALNLIAKKNTQQALSAWQKMQDAFNVADKQYFYGSLALYAAQRHEPQALQWFELAKNDALDQAGLNKDQLAWYARAALREKNWPLVSSVIDKMDTVQSQEGAWRYWKARSLSMQNELVAANTLFAKLTTERHYYGWLAQDELEGFITTPVVTHKTTEAEVQVFADKPAIKRAVALYQLDLKWESKAEWALATKAFDDAQLLAAAEFAHRRGWHDLAIVTADQTTEMHDFALRYPTPYRHLIKPAAGQQAIDEAWVYGITRQESRFIDAAKSGVGASGLMQLMPATAKWIAGKAGVEDYHQGMIHELETNIALGTYYLRYTLDLMSGQSVMATAAYNAGPSRAKKWMADVPLEGAIYVETIPFNETRLYVQKVMANAHLYTHQLGLEAITLKQRLGVVPSKTGLAAYNINQQKISEDNSN